MTRTYVVSGAASGIGAATTALLRDHGHRVVTVDRHEAEVVADLATPAGRAEAVAGVLHALAGDPLDGVVPCAGLAGMTGVDSRLLLAVNYFGAIALVEGLAAALRDAAADGRSPAVVLLSSNSTTCQPGWPTEVADACLDLREDAALAAASRHPSVQVYPASKAALAWWARREGIGPDWAGAGVRVNAVAPGMVATPMTEAIGADPELGPLLAAYPSAIGRSGRPEEVAATIAFLLGPGAALFCGTTVVVDGGADALLHPRRPRP